MRLRRSGDPEVRFWSKVLKTETCWVWQRALRPDGYGAFWVGRGVWKLAHRYAYELLVGPVPEGLVLDHLCFNRACVRPDHLEAVTIIENVMRGRSPNAENSRRTYCKRGHLFDEVNTYHRPDRPHTRNCKTCKRWRQAKVV